MEFTIGTLNLGSTTEKPNPGIKHSEWHKANTVVIAKIPGKGKKYVTIRTSDQVLDECTFNVRSITNTRYKQLKLLCDNGGPFKVVCNHGTLWMYIIDRTIVHDENDKELPERELETEEKLNVATWTVQMVEAND